MGDTNRSRNSFQKSPSFFSEYEGVPGKGLGIRKFENDDVATGALDPSVVPKMANGYNLAKNRGSRD